MIRHEPSVKSRQCREGSRVGSLVSAVPPETECENATRLTRSMTPIPESFEEYGSSLSEESLQQQPPLSATAASGGFFLDRLAHLAGRRCNDARLEHRPGAEGREKQREAPSYASSVSEMHFKLSFLPLCPNYSSCPLHLHCLSLDTCPSASYSSVNSPSH